MRQQRRRRTQQPRNRLLNRNLLGMGPDAEKLAGSGFVCERGGF